MFFLRIQKRLHHAFMKKEITKNTCILVLGMLVHCQFRQDKNTKCS